MVNYTVAFILLCHILFLFQLTYSDSLPVYLFFCFLFHIYASEFRCHIYPASAKYPNT